MPDAMHQQCRRPLCAGYAVAGGFCEQHQVLARADARGPRYPHGCNPNNRRFRWMRDAFMKRHPLCAMCGEPGGILDHILPHRGHVGRFWNQRNWQNLCVKCHGRKTARETFANVSAAPADCTVAAKIAPRPAWREGIPPETSSARAKIDAAGASRPSSVCFRTAPGEQRS
jgi:5-methylcytosine-specific restriction protein A